jgi:hypothetical protein
MSIGKKQFELSALLGSLLFIAIIALGIFQFAHVLPKGTLPISSIINISADLSCMALGYVLFICSVVDKQKNEANLNIYLLLIFSCFNAAFLDEVCWIVDAKPAMIELNMAANTLYFMGAPVMAFLFWRYVVSYLEVAPEKIKKYNNFLAAGLVLAILMRLFNPLFGHYFTITADGHYQRGNLYLLSNLYSYFTILLTLALVFRARKKFKRYQVVTLFLYAFFPLVMGVVSVFTFGPRK